MPDPMNRLAVTFITKNEERNLPLALASVKDLADELIVADSGSTDRTLQTATDAGARIYARVWSGFADQRNFAGEQATCEWILALDADEELSGELQASLRGWKAREPEFDAYEFSRCAKYLGKWIRHSGWYPDRKVRLYRRGSGRFEGAAHDSFRTSGRIGRLQGDLLHHAFETTAQHETTVEVYSSAAAQELFAAGKRRSGAALAFAPAWTFFRRIVLQAGFLDGARGWQIARLSARYTRLKYEKLARLARGESLPDPGSQAASAARDGAP
ncbi:MAG TPA: glycosyltransferase family 2 protein [Candidatus Acidoferrales bacterium]|nr:glycosyltransferase family 2 protein [Candidatus Acidoferrales bacterium]